MEIVGFGGCILQNRTTDSLALFGADAEPFCFDDVIDMLLNASAMLDMGRGACLERFESVRATFLGKLGDPAVASTLSGMLA